MTKKLQLKKGLQEGGWWSRSLSKGENTIGKGRVCVCIHIYWGWGAVWCVPEIESSET